MAGGSFSAHCHSLTPLLPAIMVHAEASPATPSLRGLHCSVRVIPPIRMWGNLDGTALRKIVVGLQEKAEAVPITPPTDAKRQTSCALDITDHDFETSPELAEGAGQRTCFRVFRGNTVQLIITCVHVLIY